MNFIKAMLVSVLFLVANNAFAISLQDLQVRDLDTISMSKIVDYNDGTLMNVDYTGSESTAKLYIGSGTLSIDAPSGTVLVSTINIAAAAYDTLGELCDYLNAQTGVACTLTGGKRDDSSVLLGNTAALVAAGSDIAAAGGYSVLIGTAAVVADDTSAYMMRIGITPQAGRRVVLKYCDLNVNVADADALQVYGKLAKYAGVSDGVVRNDTTKVIGSIYTADDTSESDGNLYGGNWIEFAKDEHVVISAGSGTGVQAVNTNFLQCFWDEK